MFDYEAQLNSGQNDRPALAPGKSVKFVVEDPATGNRSSTWVIKTGKTKDDVYIFETEAGGKWKTSLHNDGGVWRIAMPTPSS